MENQGFIAFKIYTINLGFLPKEGSLSNYYHGLPQSTQQAWEAVAQHFLTN